MTPLEAAYEYARRGWGVVPLHGITETGACTCREGEACPPKTRGKHPDAGQGRTWRVLTSGPDIFETLDGRDEANIGIATGPDHGLWVLDIDGAAGVRSLSQLVAEHEPLPATRIVRTGSGGLHYYFTHPATFTVHNSTSWLAPGIDVRGLGGQVVAPPSRTLPGTYELIADNPLADAPAWLRALVEDHARNVEQGRRTDVIAAEQVDRELLPERVRQLARFTALRDGEGRHRHFHSLVGACQEAGLTQGQTVSVVAPWCAMVDKFVGRVEQEVARSWGKVEAQSEAEAEWLGDTGTDQRPSATETAPGAPDTPAPLSAVADTDDSASQSESDDIAATWAPIDLSAILDGTYEPEIPELLPRADGVCLLYRGHVHSMHGESESGKSLVMQIEAVRVLNDGGRVAFIDFESDPVSVTGRMRELGAEGRHLRQRFDYRRPEASPAESVGEREAFLALLAEPYDLVVIDGVTDALGVWGASTNDADEVAGFMRRFPRRVAARGAAVVLIDHVTKDSETRGRFAAGSQAKMATLDGAAYVVEVEAPFGRGMSGAVLLWIAKDRPAGIRGHCPPSKRKDRLQLAARVVVDSTGPKMRVAVEAPDEVPGTTSTPGEQRNTLLMQRVSLVLSTAETPLSGRAVAATLKLRGWGVKSGAQIDALHDLEVVGCARQEGSKWVHVQAYDAASEWAENAERSPDPQVIPSDPRDQGRASDPLIPEPPVGGIGGSLAGSRGQVKEDEVIPDHTEASRSPELISCPVCFAPTYEAIVELHNGCEKCVKAGRV